MMRAETSMTEEHHEGTKITKKQAVHFFFIFVPFVPSW